MDALSNNFLPLEQRTQAADAAIAYANALVRSAVAAYQHSLVNSENNREKYQQLVNRAGDEFIAAFMAEKDALHNLGSATNRLATAVIRGKIA